MTVRYSLAPQHKPYLPCQCVVCHIQRTFAIHVSLRVCCIPRSRWSKRVTSSLGIASVCVSTLLCKTDSDAVFISRYVTVLILDLFSREQILKSWTRKKMFRSSLLFWHFQKESPTVSYVMWTPGRSFIFNEEIWEWYQSSHLYLGKKGYDFILLPYFPKMLNYIFNNTHQAVVKQGQPEHINTTASTSGWWSNE